MLIKCLNQGIKNRNSVLGRKISDICLKLGQGMRGRVAPPYPGIYRVPPPRGLRESPIIAHQIYDRCGLFFFEKNIDTCKLP